MPRRGRQKQDNSPDPHKVAVYIRVSTAAQARSGQGLGAQKTACQQYCEAMKLDVVETLIDPGITSKTPLKKRPAGEKLFELIKAGEIGGIVVSKMDRIFRNAEEAMRLVKSWRRSGTTLHIMSFGGQAMDTSSPTGRLLFGMLAIFAEFERDLISERAREAAAERKARGTKVSKSIPYGWMLDPRDPYKKKLQRCDYECRAIAMAQAWRTAGKTYQQICDELTRRGLPTRFGGKWRTCTVRKMLNRIKELDDVDVNPDDYYEELREINPELAGEIPK